jgi:glycosyltransferase involved in cell wall biosynthesis
MAADGPNALRVAAFPAGRPGLSNPFARLYAGALRDEGAVVDEFRVASLFRDRYDIVHVHWPEWVLDARSRRRAVTFLTALAWQRRRGARVVWTVHNLAHHERAATASSTGTARWLSDQLWNRFFDLVDGYFSLTESGVAAVRDAFPALRLTPAFVVPHGHYRDVYPNVVTQAEARAHLGIARQARVCLFFGQVRPYKGVLDLVRAFRRVDRPDAVLVVAGRPVSEELGREVVDAAKDDERVHVNLGLVPVDEVQHYLNAADVVALPYAETFNSGAALLALSFDRPVVAPASGSFPDLARQVGGAWIATYDGPLNEDVVRNALAPGDGARPEPGTRAPLDAFSWTSIGRCAMDAYRALFTPGS